MAHKNKFIKTLKGDSEDNTLTGDDGDNRLNGMAGNDYLDGGRGRDRLYGDAGDDILIFDPIDRNIDGGEGTDTLRFLAGGQICQLGKKRVIEDIEVIDFASSQNKLIFSAAKLPKILDSDQLIITGDSSNRVDPGGGWQFAGFSDDGDFYAFTQSGFTLKTHTGLQVLGLSESTTIRLSDANDYWQSSPDTSTGITHHIYGEAGDDSLTSHGAMDQLFGGDGADDLESQGTGAVLHGGAGNDSLLASAAAVMRGDGGSDVLRLMGDGVRIAEGGQDADLFLVYHAPEGNSDFRILDFDIAEGDRIRIVVPNDLVLAMSDLYLQPVAVDDPRYTLGYVDAFSNPRTLVQLVGSNLELSTLLPLIDLL